MNHDLLTKSICVYDRGLEIELALRLAREYGNVYYCCDLKNDFPSFNEFVIGYGFPEIEVVHDVWSVKDKVDVFCFPNIYDSAIQKELVSQGFPVWGSFDADKLELYRWDLKKILSSIGLPVGKGVKLKGLDMLSEYLKEEEDKYVKISFYRGIMETMHHINYELSEPTLAMLAEQLGNAKNLVEFIVEDSIDDCEEDGIDTWCVDGKYPPLVLESLEIKDAGSYSKVKPYEEISEPMKVVMDRFAPVLKQYGMRGFTSNEVRVTEEGIPFFSDQTSRMPAPIGESHMELWQNLGEVIWEGAHGNIIAPEPLAKYAGQVLIHSQWATKSWLPMQIPPEVRQWVKLKNCCQIDGVDCVIPQGYDMKEIGSIVAIGDSWDEVKEKLHEYADQIEAINVDIQLESLDKVEDLLEKSSEYHLNLK